MSDSPTPNLDALLLDVATWPDSPEREWLLRFAGGEAAVSDPPPQGPRATRLAKRARPTVQPGHEQPQEDRPEGA